MLGATHIVHHRNRDNSLNQDRANKESECEEGTGRVSADSLDGVMKERREDAIDENPTEVETLRVSGSLIIV